MAGRLRASITAVTGGGGGGSGTVTSVGLTVPAFLSVSGSPVTTSGTLAVTLSGTALPIANGGTGQTTAPLAINALLPSQTGNNGKFLTTDGSVASWGTPVAGAGGADTQIQYNDSGALNGSSAFTVNKTTFALVHTPIGSPTTLHTISLGGLTTFTNALLISGTVPDANTNAISISLTGATSTSKNERGIKISMSGGTYTTSVIQGIYSEANYTNTGNSFGGLNTSFQGNAGGFLLATTGNTTGLSVGSYGAAYQSRFNVGGNFIGCLASAGTTPKTMGVRGVATQENSATSLGVYGRIQATFDSTAELSFPAVSAAGLFDNGDTTSPALLAQNASATVFSVGGTGITTLGASGSSVTHVVNGSLSIIKTLIFNGTSSGTLTLSSPSAYTSYSLVLPAAQGAAGSVPFNDGAGNLAWWTATRSVGITIDGGGIAITTGVKGYIEVPYNATIVGWTILSDVSGSIVVDVWKDTYANYPPTVADTIAGSEKPTITTAVKGQDLSLSTWTTTVTAGDIIAFNVDSATTVTKVWLDLRLIPR